LNGGWLVAVLSADEQREMARRGSGEIEVGLRNHVAPFDRFSEGSSEDLAP
jgi:hypothetical protein